MCTNPGVVRSTVPAGCTLKPDATDCALKAESITMVWPCTTTSECTLGLTVAKVTPGRRAPAPGCNTVGDSAANLETTVTVEVAIAAPRIEPNVAYGRAIAGNCVRATARIAEIAAISSVFVWMSHAIRAYLVRGVEHDAGVAVKPPDGDRFSSMRSFLIVAFNRAIRPFPESMNDAAVCPLARRAKTRLHPSCWYACSCCLIVGVLICAYTCVSGGGAAGAAAVKATADRKSTRLNSSHV